MLEVDSSFSKSKTHQENDIMRQPSPFQRQKDEIVPRLVDARLRFLIYTMSFSATYRFYHYRRSRFDAEKRHKRACLS